jgi:hypothetical protein
MVFWEIGRVERWESQKTLLFVTTTWELQILHGTIHTVAFCVVILLFIIIIVSGVRLSPLGTAATSGLLYKPQMIDEGDCGAIGGMKIGRGNRSTRRKPAPEPLYPPQIPHDQTRARTRAAAVGSQRLTAWAMARPLIIFGEGCKLWIPSVTCSLLDPDILFTTSFPDTFRAQTQWDPLLVLLFFYNLFVPILVSKAPSIRSF